MAIDPDWALWRSFAAVVAAGSLSAAARRIGYSQPTLGRHIEALEQQLGVLLFDRAAGGLKPTAMALRLYEPVAAAEAALAQAARAAGQSAEDVSGPVRLAASTLLSLHILPPILRDLHRHYPGVSIALSPCDSADPVQPRDADIVLRHHPPDQPDLLVRSLGALDIVACAHSAYLGARGMPATPAALAGHDLVGPDRAGRPFPPFDADCAWRTDSPALAWQWLAAGLGIGLAPRGLVLDTPGMREVLPALGPPPLPVWVAMHRDLFLTARIRAIHDRLAQGIVDYIARTSRHPGSTDTP